MSSTSKSKYSINTNSDVLVKFDEIFANLDKNISDINQGSPPNIKDLSIFLDNSYNITSLVQIFSYSSTVNDHENLASIINKLTKVIKLASPLLELHKQMKVLIEELISNSNIKVIYRCLNNNRGNITTSALRLLTALVTFNNGAFVDPFLESFDLSLKVLPQLMVPTKMEISDPGKCKSKFSIRSNMSHFWVLLCSNASPLTRSDLLTTNKKLVSNWFKYVLVYDSTSTNLNLIKFLDEKILMEPAYKKMTKCKILGDWSLMKIVELYRNDDVQEILHEFLVKLATDEEHGLVFHDNKTWFTDLSSFNGSTNNGVTVTIGERKFKIYNKMIYNMLTNLSPWADIKQMDLVIAILAHVPELLPCYTYYSFFTNGSHDPKVSSFYIGQTLLLTRIIQLPISANFTKLFKEYVHSSNPNAKLLSSSTLIEVICPSQLNRSALSKGLLSEVSLIRHLNAQLIISIFQKYEKMKKLLSYDDNSVFANLRSEILDLLMNQKLPDISSLSGAVNDCAKSIPINKLLLLNYLKAAEYYNSVFGQTFSIHLSNINMGQSEEKFTGIDLAILDYYLQLSAKSQQNKWWNTSRGAKHTLFTIIARLPHQLQINSETRNESNSINKVVEVLSNLLEDTLVFNSYKLKDQQILNSQAYAVVLALDKFSSYAGDKTEAIEQVCKIIDESISRCVRAPYKYIDSVSRFSSGEQKLSPFFIAILEQSKFIKNDLIDDVLLWMQLFSRYMFLLGESLESMKSALSEYWKGKDILDFDFGTYELSISRSYKTFMTSEPMDSTCFEILTEFPFDKLKNSVDKVIPKADIDIIAILDRCDSIIRCDNIPLEKTESLLIDLVSMYGNYLIQKYDSVVDSDININKLNLLENKYWKPLFFDSNDVANKSNKVKLDKKCFTSGLLNEIFMSLYSKDQSLEKTQHFADFEIAVSNALSLRIASDKVESKLVDFLWILNDKDILGYLAKAENDVIKDKLFELAIQRKIRLQPDFYIGLIDKMIISNAKHKFAILAKFIKFSEDQVKFLMNKLRESSSKNIYYWILQAICESDNTKIEIVEPLISTDLDEILKSSEGFMFLQFLSGTITGITERLFKISLNAITSMVETGNIDDNILNMHLKSISTAASCDATDDAKAVITRLIEMDFFRNNASLIFSQEFSNVLLSIFTNGDSNILKPWLHRATLYITKVFAETETYELPKQFYDFLSSLQLLLFNFPIWKYVPKAMLDSQLEMILSKRWVENINVLKYAIWIIMTGSKNVIDYKKELHIFLNNPFNGLNINDDELRFYSSVVFTYLFDLNVKDLSTPEIQIKTLKFYRGSIKPADLVLKQILAKIEGVTNSSWINYLAAWDMQDGSFSDPEENYRFIVDTPGVSGGLTVSLNKKNIENTINKFNPSLEIFKLPELQNTLDSRSKDWQSWEDFYSCKKLLLFDLEGTIYDLEFLTLLVINNEELFNFQDNELTVHVRALIESNLLQLIVLCLAHENKELNQIAKKILGSCLRSIENQSKIIENNKELREAGKEADSSRQVSNFKERVMFKVFLGNLLHTLEVQEADETVQSISKLVIVFLSHLIPTLNNPGHFLYEKTYRFLLGGSKFRPFEIPIFKTISQLFTKDPHTNSENDDGDYYKQLSWFLDILVKSVSSSEDLKTMKKNGILEYLLNLSSSPFLSIKIQEQLIKVFAKIIKLENGSDWMVRSYGFLSFIDGKRTTFNDHFKGKEKIEKAELLQEYQKLLLQTIVGCNFNGEDKRSREWCDDDLENVIKRVCA